jgi:hypothetical protein
MALPKHTRKSRKVHGVTCYALNREQTLKLAEVTDQEDVEPAVMERAVIAAGTNSSAAQAEAYYANAPAGEVQDVVQAILDLSGLGDLGKESSAA